MDETAMQEQRPETGGDRVASAYEWVEAAIFALVCVVLVFTFFFRIVGVDGDSMMNTLMHRDRLILTRLGYEPEHGDIVVINRYTQEPLVKRIIAMGGDTINIDPETLEVSINGAVIDEPYLDCKTPLKEFEGPMTIPEGYVFVMGDNRVVSKDSRFLEISLINEKDIMGKAVFRLWPFNKMGGLYDYGDD